MGEKNTKHQLVVSLPEEEYTYIRTMSRVSGCTIKEFITHMIRKNMQENAEIYKKALDFRDSL